MKRSRMMRMRIALAVLACTSACARATPAQAPRFEDEIKAFEAADRASPPAPGGIVLVGSSSFRMWRDVAAAFPGVNVINRGFGGSIMPEVVHYTPRVVLPYKPRLVLVYAGDNDLNDGRTPAQVLADYNAFVALVHRALPKTRIAFVSIKPSPSRWKIVDSMRVANALVRGAVSRDSLQIYVDVFTPMLGANGRPRAELFIADSLHMTPAGYAVWRERLAGLIR
jgi:lysophospholipase L1-like esterase